MRSQERNHGHYAPRSIDRLSSLLRPIELRYYSYSSFKCFFSEKHRRFIFKISWILTLTWRLKYIFFFLYYSIIIMEISFERTWIDWYFCIPIFDFWFQIINEKIFRVLYSIFIRKAFLSFVTIKSTNSKVKKRKKKVNVKKFEIIFNLKWFYVNFTIKFPNIFQKNRLRPTTTRWYPVFYYLIQINVKYLNECRKHNFPRRFAVKDHHFDRLFRIEMVQEIRRII